MKNVLICGFGHIGYQIFQILKSFDCVICIVSKESSTVLSRIAEQPNCKVVLGDASDEALLTSLGLKSFDTVFSVTDNDLVNISVLNDVKSIHPSVKVILRLFDKNLADRLVELNYAHAVLSTSDLAAPMFLKSILNKVDKDIVSFTIFKDKLLLIKHKNNHYDVLIENKIQSSKQKKTSNLFIQLMKKIFARKKSFFFISTVFMASMLLSGWGLGLSLLDSFYFLVTTITTVGYGDINYLNATPVIKFLGSLLMLFGAASLAIIFSFLADLVLSRRLAQIGGVNEVPNEGHIILVGVNRLAYRMLQQLRDFGITCAVLSPFDKEVDQYPTPRDVYSIKGDPRDLGTMQSLNAESALGVIACTSNDILNLGACVMAKKLNQNLLTSSRIYDYSMAQKFQRTLAIDDVASISRIAAPFFVAHALRENVSLAFVHNSSLVIVTEEKSEQSNEHEFKIESLDIKSECL